MYSVLPVYYDTRSPFLSPHWSDQSLYTRLHNGFRMHTQREKRRPGLATIPTAYSCPSAMCLYYKEIITESANILGSVQEQSEEQVHPKLYNLRNKPSQKVQI